MDFELYLPIFFFLIALFYSSVGFGGGSSYLALLALIIPDFQEVRTTALLLNISVVSISTTQYIRSKQFKLTEFSPFILVSIPISFLAAQVQIMETTFYFILGIALSIAGIALILKFITYSGKDYHLSLSKKGLLGGIIGFLSGITGIGGGIYLSPILNLLSWKNAKTVAALASFFILVNSISGISGLIISQQFSVDPTFFFGLLIAVIVGGGIGNFISIKHFPIRLVGFLTAILISYVGIHLIVTTVG